MSVTTSSLEASSERVSIQRAHAALLVSVAHLHDEVRQDLTFRWAVADLSEMLVRLLQRTEEQRPSPALRNVRPVAAKSAPAVTPMDRDALLSMCSALCATAGIIQSIERASPLQ